jgi:hypothetical protein
MKIICHLEEYQCRSLMVTALDRKQLENNMNERNLVKGEGHVLNVRNKIRRITRRP